MGATESSLEPRSSFRFGPFEADLRTGEIRKFGVRVKLQSQPFKLLVALLQRPGELVTREELRQCIWGSETVVDFDHSLGTAVNKVRETLGDSADNPRYIETLARRGYRFIAPVQTAAGADLADMPAAVDRAPLETVPPVAIPAPKVGIPAPRYLRRGVLVLASATLLAGLAWIWASRRGATGAPAVRFAKITWTNRVYPGDLSLERFPGVSTDGIRIYFSEIRDGRVVLAYAAIADGESHEIITPSDILRPAVADLSPDGSKLLIRSMTWSEMEQPLWVVPSTGGAARRVISGLAHDAAWLRDGKSIVYASGRDLFITPGEGGQPRKLASLPGRAFWIRYSPDGARLRFTLLDSRTRAASLWELSADGKNLRRLFPESNPAAIECCGSWTMDGRYFLFQSTRDGTSNLWARQEARPFWSVSPRLQQITGGPLRYAAPAASPGGELFVIGGQTRSQLYRLAQPSRQLARYLPQISTAGRTELSRDYSHVAWISTADGTLWRSRTDGTQRVQLTSRQMQITLMRWSPDGTRIAFMGKEPGAPWKIYVISSDGGSPRLLQQDARSEADPEWSPDGNAIAFGRPPDYMSEDSTPKAIHIIDLKTEKVSTLPGSGGLFSPRWSPDGRYIAAMPLDQRKLLLFDMAAGKWTELVSRSINNPVWSRDSRYLYFQAFLEEDKPIFRSSIFRRELDLVTDFRQLNPADTVDFWGIDAEQSPIVSLRFFTADLYSLDWRR